MYPFDLCAQLHEFFFYALVAAIDVINAVDQGFALRDQTRQHQPGRSPQIGGHDRRPDQRLATCHHHRATFHAHPRA